MSKKIPETYPFGKQTIKATLSVPGQFRYEYIYSIIITKYKNNSSFLNYCINSLL